ncbi:hypothetical protein Z517_04180 [Fonsecaea pedrosoi CBS 271.37]|uniref:Hypervirulence associated protein TUDOR domain-containing protein n=1 Tax=Fonsecaea pedrosoi CBS 271.37 TaxID=1442368 RepID=A0A0D2F3C2_9EURO|nr:uncharacterized protein Z517_04180 [Fonsecaea pedrosoi CBS 271.37]KIW81157.1 hypothetical protein Z517_04180 [Fonsecaea pedrosoi CBS 271.37]
MSEIKSKGGVQIAKGDTVSTPVEQILPGDDDSQQAEELLRDVKGATHPPAVVFTDQNGKRVAHRPGTLRDLSKDEDKDH